MKARDTRHNRAVALKIYPIGADDDQARGEARILLSAVPHPNLPTVREDFYLDDGRYVLVMDWIEGKNLRDVLDDEGTPGLPFRTVVGYALQLASALEHLHGHEPPIVHGDVKPSNVIRTEGSRVVLVDFGISSQSHGEASTRGSAGFTPPERLSGEPPAPASDVYSLAATLCVLLCDEVPQLGAHGIFRGMRRGRRHRLTAAIGSGLALDPDRRPSPTRLVGNLIPRWRRIVRPQTRAGRVGLTLAWAAGIVATTLIAYSLVTPDLRRETAGQPAFVSLGIPGATDLAVDPARDVMHVLSDERISAQSLNDAELKRIGAPIVVSGGSGRIAVVPETGAVVIVQNAPGSTRSSGASRMEPLVEMAGRGASPEATVGLPEEVLCETEVPPGCPNAVAVHPTKPFAYAAVTQQGLVLEIDVEKNRVTRRFHLPLSSSRIASIALNTQREALFVCAGSNMTEIQLTSGSMSLWRPAVTKRCVDVTYDEQHDRLIIAMVDTRPQSVVELWAIERNGRVSIARPRIGSVLPSEVTGVTTDGRLFARTTDHVLVFDFADRERDTCSDGEDVGPALRVGSLDPDNAITALAVHDRALYGLSADGAGVYRFGAGLIERSLRDACWSTFVASPDAAEREADWRPVPSAPRMPTTTWASRSPTDNCGPLSFAPSQRDYISGTKVNAPPEDLGSGVGFGEPNDRCRNCDAGAYGILAVDRFPRLEGLTIERELADGVSVHYEAGAGTEAPLATSAEQIALVSGVQDGCQYVVWTTRGHPRIEILIDRLRRA